MSFYEKVVQHNDVLSLVSTPEHDSIGTTSSPKQGTSFSSSCKKTLPLMVPFLKACLSPFPSSPKIGLVKVSVSCSSLAYVASHLQLGLHNVPYI